jgi:hypothetical protein
MAIKLKEIIFTCLILFIGSQFCFSQEKSKPNLFASIFPHNCEYVLQHVDFLTEELEKNPNSIGYIVINRKREKSKRFNLAGFFYQDIISLHIKNRDYNQNRLRIIRGESEKVKIDFYIASDESNKPNSTEAKWNLYIPSKPILFNEGYGGQLCAETFYNLNTFSEILAAFPTARGHFVIYAESFKEFPKEKENITNEIIKIGIPLNRFKFFFEKDNNTLHPHSKLWLVPRKKK